MPKWRNWQTRMVQVHVLARVWELLASGNLLATLQKHAAGLRELFIVSRVKLRRAEAPNGDSPLEVRVAKAEGAKCERCWTYSPEVGKDTDYPTVCERCSAALKEIAKGAAQ